MDLVAYPMLCPEQAGLVMYLKIFPCSDGDSLSDSSVDPGLLCIMSFHSLSDMYIRLIYAVPTYPRRLHDVALPIKVLGLPTCIEMIHHVVAWLISTDLLGPDASNYRSREE